MRDVLKSKGFAQKDGPYEEASGVVWTLWTNPGAGKEVVLREKAGEDPSLWGVSDRRQSIDPATL